VCSGRRQACKRRLTSTRSRSTEAVVDHFEAVEIEEQDRHLLAPALGPGQGVRQTVYEQRPVRQGGERVVKGLPGELVHPAGELVDFLRLLLDGLDHPRERGHERADPVRPGGRDRLGGLRVGDEAGGAGHGRGHIPGHEGASCGEQAGEEQQRGQRRTGNR